MYKEKIWYFFCVFWLSRLWYVDQFIYLMRLVGFKSIQTGLIKKFILVKNWQ